MNLITKSEFASEKESSRVMAKMVETLIYWLKNIKDGSITPVDYRIFPDYLLPKVFNRFFDLEDNSTYASDLLVQFTIVKYLGDIVTIADQFKHLTQLSISNTFREIKKSGKEWVNTQ